MEIIYSIKDLERKFKMNRRTIYRWIEKHHIYYEISDTGRYIFKENTVKEFENLLKEKGVEN